MNATVTDLSAYAARFMRRPVSDEQIVRDRVREQLRGTGISTSRIEQACARAGRLVAAGLSTDKAMHRALSWARDADPSPNNDPPPMAA